MADHDSCTAVRHLRHRCDSWMAAGLLSGRDDLEAGRRVRRYTITDDSRAALAEARRALRELADELLQ